MSPFLTLFRCTALIWIMLLFMRILLDATSNALRQPAVALQTPSPSQICNLFKDHNQLLDKNPVFVTPPLLCSLSAILSLFSISLCHSSAFAHRPTALSRCIRWHSSPAHISGTYKPNPHPTETLIAEHVLGKSFAVEKSVLCSVLRPRLSPLHPENKKKVSAARADNAETMHRCPLAGRQG